jgi:hypothetical protein
VPIDTKTVGSNERQIHSIGDPNSASNLQSVLALADAISMSGLFASLSLAVPALLNASGTRDQMRSAIGTTGILAINSEGTKPTYSAGLIAFTPVATPTDFWQIAGSASKTVRVTRLSISGFATSAISVDVQLIKRSTASTAGTPTAATVCPHDSNDAAGTAVVNSFATNPSALGTSLGLVRAAKLNLGATGAAGTVTWDFSKRNSKGLVLRGVAQSLNLNWAGNAVPAGTLLCIDCEFTEENP